MKNVLFIIALMTVVTSANAGPKEYIKVTTVIGCQQYSELIDDGWADVGIVQDGSELRALVIVHDTDAGSSTLISNQVVTVSQNSDGYSFNDAAQTVKLDIKKNAKGFLGDIYITGNSLMKFTLKDLRCKEKLPLTYDK